MNQLTELDLFKIVAGSSFFGAILGSALTSLVNWLLSKRNFKFKSYEEIVKRRFSAYEKVSKVSLFLNMNISEEDGKIVPYAFANGIAQLEEFQMMLMEAFTEAFWLNEETADLFTELNVYCHNVNAEAVSTVNPEIALKQIASQDREKVRSLSKRISKQLRDDLVNIHEVKKFVNRTTRTKKRYPVMSYKGNPE